MTKGMTLRGGCACGSVRYDAGGEPFDVTLCHCLDCRRATGTPVAAWFTVHPAALRWEGVEPKRRASSPGVERGFCAACGTPMTFRRDALDEVDLLVGTLDDPDAVAPTDQVWVSRQVRWLRLADGLPRFARGRREE